MGEETNIEWCDHSWSPWRGCTKVSPGCAHCYAETLSKRNPAVLGQLGNGKPRVMAKNWGDPVKWNREHQLNVDASHDGMYDGPAAVLRVNRPTVFPSLCDWLDEDVPVELFARFLQLIQATPYLNWLLLTKRPELWRERLEKPSLAHLGGKAFFTLGDWIGGQAPPNVWLGASIEDQPRASRVSDLLKIPAAGRFLSLEPLLGPVDLEPFMTHGRDITDEGYSRLGGIDWVIIGGESGHGARPCNVEWIRSLVHQCKDASVPVFVKQLGARPIGRHNEALAGFPEHHIADNPIVGWKLTHPKGGDPDEWPMDIRVLEFPEGLR